MEVAGGLGRQSPGGKGSSHGRRAKPRAGAGRREPPLLGLPGWASPGARRLWWDCALRPDKNQGQGDGQGTGQDKVCLAPQKVISQEAKRNRKPASEDQAEQVGEELRWGSRRRVPRDRHRLPESREEPTGQQEECGETAQGSLRGPPRRERRKALSLEQGVRPLQGEASETLCACHVAGQADWAAAAHVAPDFRTLRTQRQAACAHQAPNLPWPGLLR